MLIRKVEFIKLLNLSKPGVRRSFIFVELLHLANYQIHRTSEFIEISNSWKPQIHRTLGPVLRVHRSPTNPCEVLALRSANLLVWLSNILAHNMENTLRERAERLGVIFSHLMATPSGSVLCMDSLTLDCVTFTPLDLS